ncbi:sulfatase-like hydrolase/transferase [Halorussus salilacus]|uniref:sulfatase-like hydrolase/transferase n=1 Tax=Halorussus salilacus TaxID=2953750 RepID=UPI0020A13855|nr:sulfatase-like hydrolase/transferase [Halorussus salilacus]USZ68857.1 sulfatase-like hydrolase/transferase [Halorussus salilacus]
MSVAERPLSELASADTVDNVLVFVSDSTRFDALPDRVAERGVTAEAIAPSTWTASSLPSLTTGRYPTTHGVWGFDTRLARTPRLLSEPENVGFDAGTIWTHVESAEKPPLWMNRLTDETTLDELEPPFVHVVHDKGGHAPYGQSFDDWEVSSEFFDAYADRPDDIAEWYERGVSESVDRFLALVDRLDERGILEDTLAVFTSDHGELLGEPSRGGIYGHSAPLVPELARVPVAFVGAGLPAGERYDHLLSGVDLAPTALSAYGIEPGRGFDGVDAWRSSPPTDRWPRSEIWSQYTFEPLDRTMPLYAATSVWSDEGGVVFHHGSTAIRTAYGLGGYLLFEGTAAAIRANMTPRKLLALARTFGPRTVTYGSVSRPMLDARSGLPTEFARSPDREPTDDAEGHLDKEQLRKLGYIE